MAKKSSGNSVLMFMLGGIFIMLIIGLVFFLINYDKDKTNGGDTPVINWWKHNTTLKQK